MATKVSAQVILRSPSGESILDATEPITAANVQRYSATAEVVERATTRLQNLGFTAQKGPQSLSLEGDKALFEQVFQTRLERVPNGEGTYYTANPPVTIPADLAAEVAAVVLPAPPRFYA